MGKCLENHFQKIDKKLINFEAFYLEIIHKNTDFNVECLENGVFNVDIWKVKNLKKSKIKKG